MKISRCNYFVLALLLYLGGARGMPPPVHAGEPQQKAGMTLDALVVESSLSDVDTAMILGASMQILF